ncbi:uracil-DNA glycosylase-like protein, partial [Dipodascopsis uninucleata]
KRRKPGRGYAPPSAYAHLSPVTDSIDENLICLFVGLNPGVMTAQKGHAFAGHTNLFWPLLFESGCVGQKLTYRDDKSLPDRWRLGITNIVSRPTAEQSELSRQEMVEGAGALETKISLFYPQTVCIVGKGIWESIYKYKTGKTLKSNGFEWGWQSPPFTYGATIVNKDSEVPEHTQQPLIFVVPSTSGRVAAYSREMKANLWKTLGDHVKSLR